MFKNLPSGTKVVIDLASKYGKPLSSVLFVGLVPLILLPANDAPLGDDTVSAFFKFSFLVISIGFSIITIFEYIKIKKQHKLFSNSKIIGVILLSWIFGPLFISLLFLAFWLAEMGFQLFVLVIYSVVHALGLA